MIVMKMNTMMMMVKMMKKLIIPWGKTSQVDKAIDGEVAQGGVTNTRADYNNNDFNDILLIILIMTLLYVMLREVLLSGLAWILDDT